MKLKSALIAASLALLVVGVGRPATADSLFMEEYGDIFGARTPTASPADNRPKNAVTAQKKKDDNGGELVVSPFYRQINVHGLLFSEYGGGLAWDGGSDHHPYSIEGDFFNSHFEEDGATADRFSWAGQGKFVVWQPADKNLPVLSVVGRYEHFNGIENRIDVAAAADERVTQNIYVTANLGLAHTEGPNGGFDQNDFAPAVGATWHPSRWSHLSLSGDYVIKNNVDGIDFWSVSAAYALSNRTAIRVGGGKENTFFGNLLWKWGK
jgi:hypothetical protein